MTSQDFWSQAIRKLYELTDEGTASWDAPNDDHLVVLLKNNAFHVDRVFDSWNNPRGFSLSFYNSTGQRLDKILSSDELAGVGYLELESLWDFGRRSALNVDDEWNTFLTE